MKKRDIKKIIIGLSVIVLTMYIICCKNVYTHRYVNETVEQCMGVPIITEEQLNKITKKEKHIENLVCLEKIRLPYEQSQNCLLVPINIDKNMKYSDLKGELESDFSYYQLFFIKEKAFEEMYDSIKNNHKFSLIAVRKNGDYVPYNVIFTTLPVVEMQGIPRKVDDRNREVYNGHINVWNPIDEKTGHISVCYSRLEWKMRGQTAMEFPKKSYKLSLQDKNGGSENISLLNLEKDDDYILNPMWMDDLKIREKLMITLWNELAELENSNIRMSNAEYCEVIINGNYQGIYLLQNRIEKKYLKLDENDIILKGKGPDKKESSVTQDIFEIIYSPLRDEETYTIVEDFLYEKDFSIINKNNWINNQLFIQLGNLIDNRRYKNMYYVLEFEGGEYIMSLLPWDTDMSLGVSWKDGFSYNPNSVESISYRIENETIIVQYPELEEMQAERWKTLREFVFSEYYIKNIINENFFTLDVSGALHRDYQIYNEKVWNGDDTRENLAEYITRRLEILDERYGLK